MMLPKVSIGITTYNRSQMVQDAIDSVLMQTYRGEIEIIVIDDGSTDNTYNELWEKYKNKIYIHQNLTNLGIAHAKNLAIQQGTGAICGLLDSDDYYKPDFVRVCVEALLEDKEVGFVYTDNVCVNLQREQIDIWPALEFELEEFLKTRNLRGDSWLAWRRILDQTCLHDSRFELEVDYDLFYQIIEITKLKRIPLALQCVRTHANRITERKRLDAAFWHSAGLGKYGYNIQYAHDRAKAFNQEVGWRDAIIAGYDYGKKLRG